MRNKNAIRSFLFLCISLCFIPVEGAQPIWKITGNGLQHPSYLFGAGSLQSVSVYNESPGLQYAFAQAGTCIVESNSSPTEFVTKIRTYGLMDKQKLKQLLSADMYKQVDKEVQNAITVGLFFLPGSIKPAALSMIICSAWLKEEMGEKNQEYLNKWLVSQSKKRKMTVVALESTEEQMDLMMNNGTPEYQAEILKSLIQSKSLMLSSYKKSQECYKRGDYEGVGRMGLEHPLPYSDKAEGLESMITKRNKQWLQKIIPQMKSKSCLILINPAQLVFDGGMIAMLKKAGYTVVQE